MDSSPVVLCEPVLAAFLVRRGYLNAKLIPACDDDRRQLAADFVIAPLDESGLGLERDHADAPTLVVQAYKAMGEDRFARMLQIVRDALGQQASEVRVPPLGNQVTPRFLDDPAYVARRDNSALIPFVILGLSLAILAILVPAAIWFKG